MGTRAADAGGGGFTAAFPILYTDDLPRLLRFYRDLLGFAEAYRYPTDGPPAFVALRLGAATLGLGTYAASEPLQGRPLRRGDAQRCEICVYAEDTDRAVAHLRAHGVAILAQPRDQPWGERLAYVEDPDGNPVQLTAPLGR